MIGNRHGDAIRALQDMTADHAARLDTAVPQVEALHARLAALELQVTALFSQLAADREVWAADAARMAHLERRLAETEQVATAQAEILTVQTGEIDLLRERAAQQDAAVRQVGAALTRIDKQAAIDLDEMRRTSAAVARAVFLQSDKGMTSTGDQGSR